VSILLNGSAQTIGIIAAVNRNSIIRNCGVYSSSGITINGNHYSINVAGISSTPDGNISSTIENCYVSMNITVTNSGTHINIQGVGGSFYNTNITNCYYIGNITSTGYYAYTHGIGSPFVEKSYSAGSITNNAGSSGYTDASGITEGLTASNSVTLMRSINLTNSTNYSRIQASCWGNSASITLTNNYAYSGMLLNGSPVTSNNANSINGLDKTAAQLKQQSTYEDGLGWDFDEVWEMGPPEYPFPILKWQNGVVKLPPGFSVIQ
jgi:hypothetical protein